MAELRYKDLTELSGAVGLHEAVAAIVCNSIGKGSSVLDLGAGHGAFSARLQDLGYKRQFCRVQYRWISCPKCSLRCVGPERQFRDDAFKAAIPGHCHD